MAAAINKQSSLRRAMLAVAVTSVATNLARVRQAANG